MALNYVVEAHSGYTLEVFPNDISLLTGIASNRWKIDSTAKTLTFYKDDGTTPMLVFDLKNDAGVASVTKIFERVPA